MKKFLAAILLSVSIVSVAEATTARLTSLEVKVSGTGEIYFATAGTTCIILNSTFLSNAGDVTVLNASSPPAEVALLMRCPSLRIGEEFPELQDQDFTVRASRVIR